jgi:hypothetical protein
MIQVGDGIEKNEGTGVFGSSVRWPEISDSSTILLET